MNRQKIAKGILIAALLVFGIVGRLMLQDFPNIETVTAASLLAGALLGFGWGVALPLLVIAATDIVIGNNSIMIFTWSAFALIGLSGCWLRKKADFTPKFAFQMTGLGVGAAVFFYLYTNFGVWLLFPMYPHTWAGLAACYVAGIPFFKYSLASTLIMVPVATVGFTYLKEKLFARALKTKSVPVLPSRS